VAYGERTTKAAQKLSRRKETQRERASREAGNGTRHCHYRRCHRVGAQRVIGRPPRDRADVALKRGNREGADWQGKASDEKGDVGRRT